MANNIDTQKFEKLLINEENKFINTFWSTEKNMFNQFSTSFIKEGKVFSYWWHAHSIDFQIDMFERDGNPEHLKRAKEILLHLIIKNGYTIYNDFYDDMIWLALALVRLYKHDQELEIKNYLFLLWEDIKNAWNDLMHGGMAWRKDMLYYKNTPANAPASILAAKLYKTFGNEQDLWWAKRIFNYNKEYLYNDETGQVYDGWNRENNEKIDDDWIYSYCQGTFIGAACELFTITNDAEYIKLADKALEYTWSAFLDNNDYFRSEGDDDCGLFKGILIRYIVEHHKLLDSEKIKNVLIRNAMEVFEQNGEGEVFSATFVIREVAGELPSQLSAMFLLEGTWKLIK